jgi:hypothetical protein
MTLSMHIFNAFVNYTRDLGAPASQENVVIYM